MFLLNDPSSMPKINGVTLPSELYVACNDQAPLAGMRHPLHLEAPWMPLFNAGFHWVTNLVDKTPPYNPYPLQTVTAMPLEDLVNGLNPSDPEEEYRRVLTTTRRTYELLTKGEGVLVHCQSGTGRTGTVIGCVLRLLGYSADTVLAGLNHIHQVRGKGGWPESRWQAEIVRDIPLRDSESPAS